MGDGVVDRHPSAAASRVDGRAAAHETVERRVPTDAGPRHREREPRRGPARRGQGEVDACQESEPERQGPRRAEPIRRPRSPGGAKPAPQSTAGSAARSADRPSASRTRTPNRVRLA